MIPRVLVAVVIPLNLPNNNTKYKKFNILFVCTVNREALLYLRNKLEIASIDKLATSHQGDA